jgi:hypothetical protein
VNYLISSTFSVILLMLGRPERSSSATDIRPTLKRECYRKTSVRLKECSPKASQSISRVSVTDLPSFMQNFMQTRCSILPSIAEEEEKRRESSSEESATSRH